MPAAAAVVSENRPAAPLRAPFPYFGGKSRIAPAVWERFGDPAHYIEPFAGSLAVLLARPANQLPATETVNDLDGYITNFWRAVRADPDAVTEWADWPVNENDLHARHYWLVTDGRPDVDRLAGDPDYYDAKVAGWWVWGACAWIGSGWCGGRCGRGPWRAVDGRLVNLGNTGHGISRKLPHIGNNGRGIGRKLPRLSAGQGNERRAFIAGWLTDLSARLRDVRVACGDWQRVLTDTVLFAPRVFPVAVFLDPPYATPHAAGYNKQQDGLAEAVRAWCLTHGADPRLRLALCGYAGEHDELERHGWQCVAWQQGKGYQKAGADGHHSGRLERVWFSPHCLTPGDAPAAPPLADLFAGNE